MTRGLDEEKDETARTGHEDRHVSWGGSSLLLIGGLGEPGLKRKNEGDPREAWVNGFRDQPLEAFYIPADHSVSQLSLTQCF
jgi:hypothetical protein